MKAKKARATSSVEVEFLLHNHDSAKQGLHISSRAIPTLHNFVLIRIHSLCSGHLGILEVCYTWSPKLPQIYTSMYILVTNSTFCS